MTDYTQPNIAALNAASSLRPSITSERLKQLAAELTAASREQDRETILREMCREIGVTVKE